MRDAGPRSGPSHEPSAHEPVAFVAETGQLARDTWYGLLAQAVDKILPVVLVLYLARTLGAADFGSYTFIIAYLALFQVGIDYSFDTVLLRAMSQKAADRLYVFQSGLGLKLIVTTGCALAATLLVVPVSGGRTPMGLMALASLGLVTALGSAYRVYYRSALNIRAVFYIAAWRAVLLAGGVLAAVSASAGLPGIFAAMAVANALSFCSIALAVRREVPPVPRRDTALWRTLARGALPLAANAFAITVSLRAGQIMLMSLRGPVEVGLLGAASRVTEAFVLLPDALMITVYPLMAHLHVSDPRRMMRTAERATRYLVTAMGVPVLLCVVAGSEVMRVLFGPSFAEAGSTLGILAFMAITSAYGTVLVNLLVAVHRESTLYRVSLGFAVLNIALSFPAIEAYGYQAAAVVMALTSFGSQMTLAVLPRTRAYVLPCLRSALAPAGAVALAAAGGLAVRLGPGHSAIAASAVAAIIYGLGLMLLGVANRGEISFLRSLLWATPADPEE